MPTADTRYKPTIKTEDDEIEIIPTRWYYNSGKTKKYVAPHELENKFSKWKNNSFKPLFTRNKVVNKTKEETKTNHNENIRLPPTKPINS